MKPVEIEAALEDEFACNWQVDELPYLKDQTLLETEWPPFIRNSAIRLRQSVGDAQIPALKQYLESIKLDSDHTFLSYVMNHNGPGWADSPEDWKLFQQLLDLLKNAL